MMIAEVWRQDAEMRRSVVEWVYGVHRIGAGELSDAEFERYIALTETEAGVALNSALFQAFDVVFTQVSYELGVAAARFMTIDDI